MAEAKTRKRYYTVPQANATLPLVSAIVRDITVLAEDLQERQARVMRVIPEQRGSDAAHREELDSVKQDLIRDFEKMKTYERELAQLGVELKDYRTGLIDFPALINEREVYLCWRLGEPEVAFWHELDAGFAGRQELLTDAELN
jgi:hypothetical protein